MDDDGGIELMRHALGVRRYIGPGGRPRFTKPYRNHFCAGGKDRWSWDVLVGAGYARLVHPGGGGILTDDCPTYAVTEEGRQVALDGIVFKRKWGYEREGET